MNWTSLLTIAADQRERERERERVGILKMSLFFPQTVQLSSQMLTVREKLDCGPGFSYNG